MLWFYEFVIKKKSNDSSDFDVIFDVKAFSIKQ